MCVKVRFYSKICQLITDIKTSYENNRKAMFTCSKRREHIFIYFTSIQDHKCKHSLVYAYQGVITIPIAC